MSDDDKANASGNAGDVTTFTVSSDDGSNASCSGVVTEQGNDHDSTCTLDMSGSPVIATFRYTTADGTTLNLPCRLIQASSPQQVILRCGTGITGLYDDLLTLAQ